MLKNVAISVFFVILSVGVIRFFMGQINGTEMKLSVESVDDIVHLFPKTVDDIIWRVKKIKESAKKEVEAILAIPHEQRTFENTARALDVAVAYNFFVPCNTISVFSYISSDDALRNAANKAQVELSEFAVDMFSQNVALYEAFKAYVEGNATKESLTDEQRYFLKETMDDFRRNGLHLPQEKRDVVKKLEKRFAALSVEFEDAVNTDTGRIEVTRDELNGMDDDFIKGLEKTSDDKYILKTDYPTYFPIMDYCHVVSTRKKMFHLFANRAYPKNVAVLNEIIAVRDELAKILGFESYAALNLDNEMAKTPARVKAFLDNLVAKAALKERQEYELIKKNLPASVEFVDGKMQPWDIAYLEAQYKKNHFNLDEREVAQYFPMESTVKGLLDIYKQFFNIEFKEIPISGLWHPEVTLVQVQKGDIILGYLLLDLYPRKNKYGHACETIIIPALQKNGVRAPAVSVVIANFPKSTSDKPSLLKIDDVRTFFHEFGHAMHEILGATDMASFAGTHVKTDFVEMPSQMLEEWLWDAAILKGLSKHFQTGLPIPDKLIETIIGLKNFSSGTWILRQSLYSFMSLDYFAPGAQKDCMKIMNDIRTRILPHLISYPENHSPFSFGHLTGYGARYYSYLWSKVFAIDLFNYIKQYGLLNPEIGERYATTILAKGGSKDPNQLLKDFLGREPNEQAFFKDLGL